MIPDNKISTTEGQETTTTPSTEHTRLQCPTNDSKYGLMDGRCVYFEETSLTYDKAIQNCQEKLKDYGGGVLYEPYSIAEQKRIVDMAYEHGSSSWHWIGVTDKTTEGQYTYNSNGQAIDFNPVWYTSEYGTTFGSEGTSSNCIEMHVTDDGKWADIPCTDLRPSICWSINQ